MLLIPSFLHWSRVIYSLVPNSEVSCTGNVSASSSQELNGNFLYGRGAVKDWLSDVLKHFVDSFIINAERLDNANRSIVLTVPFIITFIEMVASIPWWFRDKGISWWRQQRRRWFSTQQDVPLIFYNETTICNEWYSRCNCDDHPSYISLRLVEFGIANL